MEETRKTKHHNEFLEVLTSAYDKGINEQGLTLERLLEMLKTDLKQIIK